MRDTNRISSSNKGALAELAVCSNLLIRRYHVFRCVSPACPFDLVVSDGKKCFRLEVKFSWSTKFALFLLRSQNKKILPSKKHDILAVYDHETKKIHYVPKLKKIFGA